MAETHDTIRNAHFTALKHLGFENVMQLSEVKTVFEYLDSGEPQPDWVITGLMPEKPANGMHLLDTILRHTGLHKTKVSFILERPEIFCMRNAFEMGLLSWHPKNGSHGDLIHNYSKFLKIIEAYDWNPSLTAAEYLRVFLKADDSIEELLELNKSLLLRFPKNNQLILKHAEALFESGKNSQALLLLTHAKTQDAKIAKEADTLQNKFSISQEQALAHQTEPLFKFADRFELNCCVVIDSDESVRNHLLEVLTELGVKQIECFADGEEAWNWFSGDVKPGLVIQEWKIPKLSGPALIQRVRSKGFVTLPFIVYSSVVTAKDRFLLREIGVSDIIGKPLSKKMLLQTLKAVIEQEFNNAEVATLERKVQQELAAKNFPSAKHYLDSYEDHPKATEATKAALRAEYLYHTENYEDAKAAAVQAFHSAGESLALLNLLGKILLKMKDFELAKKFFNKANAISPSNLERLCNLAEAQMETGDAEGAEEALNQATKVDPENSRIYETQAKLALSKGDIQGAKEIIAKLSSTKELVSYINNKAVSLAHENKLDESMDLYNKALRSLPTRQNDLMAVIRYNMGLGCAKQGNKEKADEFLSIAISFKNSPVFAKASSLGKRVKQSIAKGTKLEFKNSSPKEEKDASESDSFQAVGGSVLAVAQGIKVGEMCCHLIYQSPQGIDPMVQTLLANKPRYLDRVGNNIDVLASTDPEPLKKAN